MVIMQSSSYSTEKETFSTTIFMNNEAETSDATAFGLSVALQSYSFIAGVYFRAEVLSPGSFKFMLSRGKATMA